jgi:hypothetical protein
LVLSRKTLLWDIVTEEYPNAKIDEQIHQNESGSISYKEKYMIIDLGSTKLSALGHTHHFPEDWIVKVQRDAVFWEAFDRVCAVTDSISYF